MEQGLLVLILAGGQSRRMGSDKALLPFAGETMLASMVRRFSVRFPVAVSLREAGQFDTAGAPALVDEYPGQGPLAGLQAAFSQTEAEWIFLTGTDLPFLSVELAEALLARTEAERGVQAFVLMRADGKTEPLCGVYHRSCLPALEEALRQGRRSFKGLFARLTLRFVQEEELPQFDLAHQLDNLNTPEDYQRAVYK